MTDFDDELLYADGRVMRGYHRTISRATGRTDVEQLEEIEDCMRHDIFHSTLDWQTREELEVGARLAVQVLTAMGEAA